MLGQRLARIWDPGPKGQHGASNSLGGADHPLEDDKSVKEVLKLLAQNELHQAEHEIQELLGKEHFE